MHFLLCISKLLCRNKCQNQSEYLYVASIALQEENHMRPATLLLGYGARAATIK